MSSLLQAGRETSIFTTALLGSAAANYLVKYNLSKNEHMDQASIIHCVKRAKETTMDDEAKLSYARCIRSNMIEESIKAALAANTVSILTVTGPMFGVYFAFDELKYGKDKRTRTIILGVTFAVLCTIMHSFYAALGRPRSHLQVWFFSSLFGLNAAGLSALMHEFL